MRSLLLVAGIPLALPSTALAAPADGRIGPSLSRTGNGRLLRPAGDMVTVGGVPPGGGAAPPGRDFPMAGALTPDGRFYWAIDAGHGHNDVKVVDVAQRAVVQSLPLPVAGWGIAVAPDGRTAYVPGTAKGRDMPEGPTKGDGGDV